MKQLTIGIAVLFVVGAIVLVTSIGLQGQAKLTWTYTHCYTNTCIANALNSLSESRAAEAKITTWADATYVWYRK